ncbi:MAG: hypothetical protein KAT90_10815 [Gammaproteobacteria bacterium]|nr:hypothetical protein [Gammaproteobacteria bacterium]
MEKTEKMPIWVFLAFSSIETRKGALILIGACALFSLYCIPFPLFFENNELIKTLFLIDDWSWIAMMAPITFWYWISLKWLDNNSGWKKAEPKT